MKENYLMLNGQQINFTPEQIAKITEIMGGNQKKLRDIEVGGTFKIDEHEFFVLEHYATTTAVLYKGLLENNMDFGKNNNFADCDCKVRARLERFATELEVRVGKRNLIEHNVDLTSDDGLDDYGKTTAKVSLLTCNQYRKYVRVIDKHKVNNWWWMATPYSTPTHEDAEWVKCVSPRGCIYFYYYDYDLGVRPFCIFDSNIFVF